MRLIRVQLIPTKHGWVSVVGGRPTSARLLRCIWCITAPEKPCSRLCLGSDREDPFASIIRCTADPAKADNRTRSKWSRAMRYAAVYKPDSEPLGQFIRRNSGINECAARFSRRIG
jgi:hypothetical protein